MVSVMESLLLVNQRLGQCSQSWSISCKNSTDRIDTQQGQQLFDGWFSQVEENVTLWYVLCIVWESERTY